MSPAAILLAAAVAGAPAQNGFSPARYRSGSVPVLPAMAVGGGEVILEVSVASDGSVSGIKVLRATSPFTDLVSNAVRRWHFSPAEDRDTQPGARQPTAPSSVASKILVAAVYRPPALRGPTLGENPRDIAAASDAIPFPIRMAAPPFPPLAASPGVVLLEAQIDRGGRVTATTVLVSKPPFDEAARGAVEDWTFRPAKARGAPASTFVYILFGFPAPATADRP